MWIRLLCLVLTVGARAAPVEHQRAVCTTKTQRRPWHTLMREEKLAYIEAEKCLMSKPAKLGLHGARTIFDEMQLAHVYETTMVHGVGAFLPYHRFYMHAHEYLLRTECNYTAGQPYWEESIDAGNFTTSIILDPETGFGGNGVGPSNCIANGPFKDYVNAIGPGQNITDHCIDRIISDCFSQLAAKRFAETCMKAQNFSSFWPCIEGGPHSAGHGGIGGQMMNVFSSPGDPLFYLHHTYLDKLWWDWQSQNISTRLADISGRNYGLPFGGFPGGNFTFPPGFNGTFPPIGSGPGAPPGDGNCTGFGFPGGPGGFPGFPPGTGEFERIPHSDGDPGNETTLGHVLTVHGIVPNATIRNVMDIQGDTLCYEYL